MGKFMSKKRKKFTIHQVSFWSPEMLGKLKTKLSEQQHIYFFFLLIVLAPSDKCFWKWAHPRSRHTHLRRAEVFRPGLIPVICFQTVSSRDFNEPFFLLEYKIVSDLIFILMSSQRSCLSFISAYFRRMQRKQSFILLINFHLVKELCSIFMFLVHV